MLDKVLFDLDEKVWVVRSERVRIECKDCGGSGRVSATLANQKVLEIDCPTCYNKYKYKHLAKKVTIESICIERDCIEYHFYEGGFRESDKVFATELEAVAMAVKMEG